MNKNKGDKTMENLFNEKTETPIKIGDEKAVLDKVIELCLQGKKCLSFLGYYFFQEYLFYELLFKHASLIIEEKFRFENCSKIIQAVKYISQWKLYFNIFDAVFYKSISEEINKINPDYIFFDSTDFIAFKREDFQNILKGLKIPIFFIKTCFEEEIVEKLEKKKLPKLDRAAVDFIIDFVDKNVKIDIILPAPKEETEIEKTGIYTRRKRILSENFKLKDGCKSLIVGDIEFYIPEYFNKKTIINEDVKTWEMIFMSIFSEEISQGLKEANEYILNSIDFSKINRGEL